MKRVSLLLWFLLLFSCAYAQMAEISIEVSGIQVDLGGDLEIAIYTEQGFLERGKEVAHKIIKVENDKVKIRFTNVKPGVYAAAVFQDANQDYKINKNRIGFPIEPYGFSNNNAGRMGPPEFEDASFELEESQTVYLQISLE